MRPRTSVGSPRLRIDGCAVTPAVHTTVRVGRTSPVASRTEVGGQLLERRAEPDVDAAAAQLPDGVLGQRQVDLRQHAVHRLDQHPAHPVQARGGVLLDRVRGEVLHLGQRLEAGVAAADHHEGQQLVALARVVRGVGHLQALDHVVAQPDRVRQRLEADRVLLEPRDRQHARHRAVRDHQTVVPGLVLVRPPGRPS